MCIPGRLQLTLPVLRALEGTSTLGLFSRIPDISSVCGRWWVLLLPAQSRLRIPGHFSLGLHATRTRQEGSLPVVPSSDLLDPDPALSPGHPSRLRGPAAACTHCLHGSALVPATQQYAFVSPKTAGVPDVTAAWNCTPWGGSWLGVRPVRQLPRPGSVCKSGAGGLALCGCPCLAS